MTDEYIDLFEETEPPPVPTENHVYIRLVSRTNRFPFTTIEGLPSYLDPKKILRCMKREFWNVNGTIVEDPQRGRIIQLYEDRRSKCVKFLVENNLVPKSLIKIDE